MYSFIFRTDFHRLLEGYALKYLSVKKILALSVLKETTAEGVVAMWLEIIKYSKYSQNKLSCLDCSDYHLQMVKTTFC